MKFGSFSITLLMVQAVALADVPTREKITCTNEHYTLVLRETAVPTYKTATLSFSGRNISLKCQGEFQDKNVSYTCVENRDGEGKYLAGVVLVDGTGTAEVAHEQAYPLSPKSLATLACEVSQE